MPTKVYYYVPDEAGFTHFGDSEFVSPGAAVLDVNSRSDDGEPPSQGERYAVLDTEADEITVVEVATAPEIVVV